MHWVPQEPPSAAPNLHKITPGMAWVASQGAQERDPCRGELGSGWSTALLPACLPACLTGLQYSPSRCRAVVFFGELWFRACGGAGSLTWSVYRCRNNVHSLVDIERPGTEKLEELLKTVFLEDWGLFFLHFLRNYLNSLIFNCKWIHYILIILHGCCMLSLTVWGLMQGPWLCWRFQLSSSPMPWSFARCTALKPLLQGEAFSLMYVSAGIVWLFSKLNQIQ